MHREHASPSLMHFNIRRHDGARVATYFLGDGACLAEASTNRIHLDIKRGMFHHPSSDKNKGKHKKSLSFLGKDKTELQLSQIDNTLARH